MEHYIKKKLCYIFFLTQKSVVKGMDLNVTQFSYVKFCVAIM